MGEKVNIHEACKGLKEGKTLLYPTDTVWGLGCDATNENAIEQIYKIKNRPKEKSFVLLVDSVAMLERYVSNFPDVCYDLIDFATRPTTIVFEIADGLPQMLLAKDGSIAIRVTQDLNCKKLIQSIRKPLVSTSANISSEPSPSCFDDISDTIKSSVDLILDERLSERMKKPSSIIKVGNNNDIKVIR